MEAREEEDVQLRPGGKYFFQEDLQEMRVSCSGVCGVVSESVEKLRCPILQPE